MPNEPERRASPFSIFLRLFVFLAILALFAFAFIYRVTFSDYLKSINYEPSADMLEIRDSLGLTPEGLRIFNATRPTLDSREDFNRDCDSSNPEFAVYGCYRDDNIFIYDVDSSDLAGFRESTTAHELLHAVWSRLSGIEKNELLPLLESAYADNRSVLEENLKIYSEDAQLDELYVRLATQIKDLPPELEEHYARIFTNQDAVVDFYESYITPFEELKTKISSLKSEIDSLETIINQTTSDYETRSAAFDSEVTEFNTCAQTLNCFSSEFTFHTRRNELLAQQNSLNELYAQLNSLIDEYNSKVEEYNSNVFHSNTLQNLVNSNSKVNNVN